MDHLCLKLGLKAKVIDLIGYSIHVLDCKNLNLGLSVYALISSG